MAKNPGIISTTQDAITDVARSGFEGARSIAGIAADTAADAANSAAKAVTSWTGSGEQIPQPPSCRWKSFTPNGE